MRFDGRVALITGGGRGIGAATAHLLHAEGARVAVSDVDVAPAEEVARPLEGLALACDVTSREQVEAMVARTVKELGRLDILVACAGITRDNLLFKMTDDDWDSVIDTHLKGTFFCARAVQKQMVEQKYGKMVFLSSTSALGNRGQTNYSTAKAGLQGMARTLAIELGPFNVNVNAVAPGFVDTRMTRATAERMGIDYEAFKQGAASQTPLRRVGRPEDIASVIAFLCSEEAGFVSGQTIYVRGGP
ncbi:MAG TPA: 3-oxoacyl-ACP reductase FabG [Candidatus Dormibacteraeota bacterium]|nr:3-oxoacyl-ACP reductase FabG [Candidatus Dormibacteraeota bacterium]